MRSTLRVEPHIRGHVAWCNGSVEDVGVKVEQCKNNPQSASEVAALMSARAEQDRDRKKKELERFRRRVKQRATEWERLKKQQLAVNTTQTIASEQRIVEQAVQLDKKKKSCGVGQDIEDVHMVASKECALLTPLQPGVLSPSQIARKKLLSLKGLTPQSSNTSIETSSSVHFSPSVQYKPVTTLNESIKKSCHIKSHPKVPKPGQFTNPGYLDHVKKKQAALQHLLFRRLYSDLEREKARQKQRQLTQAQQVEALKKDKEASRRLIEEEANEFDSSFSTVNSEATEDRERAREWSELMLLEERKQRLQKSRENERYFEALRARLKERVLNKHTAVLPLCSCGTTIWDADPYTCANNCPFYRNPKALEKALAVQLQSLEL